MSECRHERAKDSYALSETSALGKTRSSLAQITFDHYGVTINSISFLATRQHGSRWVSINHGRYGLCRGSISGNRDQGDHTVRPYDTTVSLAGATDQTIVHLTGATYGERRVLEIGIGAGNAPAAHCAGPGSATHLNHKQTEKREDQQTSHHEPRSGKDTACLRKETLHLIDAEGWLPIATFTASVGEGSPLVTEALESFRDPTSFH